jgi:hypothetical protein
MTDIDLNPGHKAINSPHVLQFSHIEIRPITSSSQSPSIKYNNIFMTFGKC